jgi:hypothetical protein
MANGKAKSKKNPKGAGRATASVTIEQIANACKIGAKCIEIAAMYNCHIDTITNRIKAETEFSNYSEFREFHLKAGDLQLRNNAFAHAKKSPEFCKWMMLNHLGADYSARPHTKESNAPSIQIIDSQDDKDYSLSLDAALKTLKTEDARKLIIDLTSLLPHQRTFIQAKESLVALVAGFGSGKTHVFIRKILVNAFTKFNKKNKSKSLS